MNLIQYSHVKLRLLSLINFECSLLNKNKISDLDHTATGTWSGCFCIGSQYYEIEKWKWK